MKQTTTDTTNYDTAYALAILLAAVYGWQNQSTLLGGIAAVLMLGAIYGHSQGFWAQLWQFIQPHVKELITAVSTPVSLPANTPEPNMFELTATAYFGDFPTALPAQPTATPMPTETPRPMIEPTWTDYQWQTNGTPEPTVFLCNTVEDVTSGCTPRTPVPGN